MHPIERQPAIALRSAPPPSEPALVPILRARISRGEVLPKPSRYVPLSRFLCPVIWFLPGRPSHLDRSRCHEPKSALLDHRVASGHRVKSRSFVGEPPSFPCRDPGRVAHDRKTAGSQCPSFDRNHGEHIRSVESNAERAGDRQPIEARVEVAMLPILLQALPPAIRPELIGQTEEVDRLAVDRGASGATSHHPERHALAQCVRISDDPSCFARLNPVFGHVRRLSPAAASDQAC